MCRCSADTKAPVLLNEGESAVLYALSKTLLSKSLMQVFLKSSALPVQRIKCIHCEIHQQLEVQDIGLYVHYVDPFNTF